MKPSDREDLIEAANVLHGLDGVIAEADYRKLCRLANRLRGQANRRLVNGAVRRWHEVDLPSEEMRTPVDLGERLMPFLSEPAQGARLQIRLTEYWPKPEN